MRTDLTRPGNTAPTTIDLRISSATAFVVLEQRAAREDDVLAAFLELDDAERVDLADVLRRLGVADDVDLRERAERALAAEPDLVAPLHVALTLPSTGMRA